MEFPLALTDLQVIGEEPRVQDVRLAEVLEMRRPRDIRQLIERNATELRRYGMLDPEIVNDFKVRGAAPQTPQGAGGRPGKSYWLNEPQALLVCMRSDAPTAPDVRQNLIEICLAWRRGHLAPLVPDIVGTLDDRVTKIEEELAAGPAEAAGSDHLKLRKVEVAAKIFGLQAGGEVWFAEGLRTTPSMRAQPAQGDLFPGGGGGSA